MGGKKINIFGFFTEPFNCLKIMELGLCASSNYMLHKLIAAKLHGSQADTV